MDTDKALTAWRSFAEILAGAPAILDWPGLELDDLDRAEGLRYLARLTSVAVDAHLGTRSPRHPAFQLLSNGFGIDNPDNRYLGAPVDPAFDYVVRGRLRSLSYLSFAAQNQNFAESEAITGGAGHLNARELDLGPDRSFEMIASVREHPGNWLRMADDTSLLLARQTRADPATERWVDLSIERIGDDEPVPALDPTTMPDRLAMVALYAVGASRWFVDWVSPWLERPNTFELSDPAEQRKVGGDPNIRSQSGYWTLGPGEALEVEFRQPACDYWNIQLANVWAESLDVRRQAWLNNKTATIDADGVARFLISHEDPAEANWLDTAGHRHGLMHIRFVNSDGWPLATTRLVRPGR